MGGGEGGGEEGRKGEEGRLLGSEPCRGDSPQRKRHSLRGATTQQCVTYSRLYERPTTSGILLVLWSLSGGRRGGQMWEQGWVGAGGWRGRGTAGRAGHIIITVGGGSLSPYLEWQQHQHQLRLLAAIGHLGGSDGALQDLYREGEGRGRGKPVGAGGRRWRQ